MTEHMNFWVLGSFALLAVVAVVALRWARRRDRE